MTPLVRVAAFTVILAMAQSKAGAGTFTHTLAGYTVDYPGGWQTTASQVVSAESVFRVCTGSCTTQIIPAASAEISVAVMPPALDEYAEFDRLSLLGAESDVSRTSRLDPPPARLSYKWGGGMFQMKIVAIRRGGKLFFVTLHHHLTTGQTGSEYNNELDSVAASLRVP